MISTGFVLAFLDLSVSRELTTWSMIQMAFSIFALPVVFKLKRSKVWDKKEIKELFYYMIPDFGHKETGKYLDNKM